MKCIVVVVVVEKKVCTLLKQVYMGIERNVGVEASEPRGQVAG
jgi:hypothetical protein